MKKLVAFFVILAIVSSSFISTTSAYEDRNSWWEFITVVRQIGLWLRSTLVNATYDVGYSFYTERTSDWNELGGWNICFESDPKWANDSDPNANILEIRLYKKTGWWSTSYEWVRTMTKNNGTQKVKWHAPNVGEYRINLKMAKQTDKWVYDGNARLSNCE